MSEKTLAEFKRFVHIKIETAKDILDRIDETEREMTAVSCYQTMDDGEKILAALKEYQESS